MNHEPQCQCDTCLDTLYNALSREYVKALTGKDRQQPTLAVDESKLGDVVVDRPALTIRTHDGTVLATLQPGETYPSPPDAASPLPPTDPGIFDASHMLTGQRVPALAAGMPKDFSDLADSVRLAMGADDRDEPWVQAECDTCQAVLGWVMTDGDAPMLARCTGCMRGAG